MEEGVVRIIGKMIVRKNGKDVPVDFVLGPEEDQRWGAMREHLGAAVEPCETIHRTFHEQELWATDDE